MAQMCLLQLIDGAVGFVDREKVVDPWEEQILPKR